MTENPFGEDVPDADKRNYLVLMSAGKDNAALAQQILKNIQQHIDKNAAPLWVDSKGVGIFVSTSLVASEIWKEAFRDGKPEQLRDTRDFLVLELGEDWGARRDAKTEHWLSTHIGTPRAPAPHRGSRRP